MTVNWRIFSLSLYILQSYWIRKCSAPRYCCLLFMVLEILLLFTRARYHTVVLWHTEFYYYYEKEADANEILWPSNKSQEILLLGDDNASFLFDWFRSQIWVIISGNRDWYIMMCLINIRAHKSSTKLISWKQLLTRAQLLESKLKYVQCALYTILLLSVGTNIQVACINWTLRIIRSAFIVSEQSALPPFSQSISHDKIEMMDRDKREKSDTMCVYLYKIVLFRWWTDDVPSIFICSTYWLNTEYRELIVFIDLWKCHSCVNIAHISTLYLYSAASCSSNRLLNGILWVYLRSWHFKIAKSWNWRDSTRLNKTRIQSQYHPIKSFAI